MPAGQYSIKGRLNNSEGQQVPGYFIVTDTAGNILVGPTETDAGGYFEFWANPGDKIIFGAEGYTELAMDAGQHDNLLVVLKKSGTLTLLLLLTVAGIVYFYMSRNKKVGALETKDIIPIFYLAGGIVGFVLIKQILEALGIWKDQDTKDLDNAAGDPNSFWNPNFWKGSQNYSYAIDLPTAQQLVTEIYNAFGAFNDCEECVIGIFRSMRTKANVSFLSYVFQQKYGMDLLKFLRGGIYPQDRLSDTDVAEINRYVKQLPDY